MTEQADLKARAEELLEALDCILDGFHEDTKAVRQNKRLSLVCSADDYARVEVTAENAAEIIRSLLSRITDLEAERDEARNELAAHDRAMANERRRWREHPMMQRLDEVRRSIAGLRPGDAEWLATAQSEFLDVEARAQAAESRLALAEKVVEAGRVAVDAGSRVSLKSERVEAFRALSSALTAFAENTSSNDLTTGEDDA